MDVIGERAEQRVYDILYMLCERFGGELRFTSKEIVELSGTKTETLIRIFAGLKSSISLPAGGVIPHPE